MARDTSAILVPSAAPASTSEMKWTRSMTRDIPTRVANRYMGRAATGKKLATMQDIMKAAVVWPEGKLNSSEGLSNGASAWTTWKGRRRLKERFNTQYNGSSNRKDNNPAFRKDIPTAGYSSGTRMPIRPYR